MFTRGRKSVARRAAGVVVAALVLTAFAPVPASAEGLFEALFGGFRRMQPPPPPQAHSFADPLGMLEGRRSGEYRSGDYGGGSGTYCVRTCDGRFFPLQRNASASPADLCKSFCPAAKTMIFSGGKIDYAVASNGMRYADLDNAFVYRERVVDNCTCNGKDAFGLVRVDVAADPTLRPGDIVATTDGLAAYRGNNSARGAEFSPVNPSALPGEWGKRLSALKVTPVPAQQKVQPVAEDTTATARKDRRQERRRVYYAR